MPDRKEALEMVAVIENTLPNTTVDGNMKMDEN